MSHMRPRDLTSNALRTMAVEVAAPSFSAWALLHGEVEEIPGARGPKPFVVVVEEEEEKDGEKAALLYAHQPSAGPDSSPIPYRVPLWDNFVRPLRPKRVDAWLEIGTNWVAWARPVGPTGPRGEFTLIRSFPVYDRWGVHYGLLTYDLLVVWVEGQGGGPFPFAAVLYTPEPEVYWRGLTCSGMTREAGEAYQVNFYGEGGAFSAPTRRGDIIEAARALPQFGAPEGVVVVSGLELACPV